jgi:hypothetical protein
MQEKTWTLRTVDGQTYEGLSKQDATLMLARMIYGVEPAREAQVSRMPVVEELAAPIAA